ncbi:MAG: choice-of-anchor D domain-containing protein, partial [Chlorobi bacterium]|nr:choice-of-anchor D domain-containing protein [Chlorobiota bacterium]
MRWFVLGFVLAASAAAQLQLRVLSAVDSSSYPLLSAIARLTLNGNPTTPDGALISSSRYSIPSQRIDVLDVQSGMCRVTWLADPRLQTETYSRLIVWKGTLVASDSVRLPRMPIVRVVNQRGEPVEEVMFGQVEAGTSSTARFYVQLFAGRSDSSGMSERPIVLDSIVSSSPVFRVEWVGWASGSSLPTKVYSPLLYLVRVHCTPPDTNFHSGTITLYYDGALSFSIPVQCNNFPLPAPQRLRLTSPRGDTILAPCSTVTLAWSGSAPSARIALDYSTDDGSSWTPIGITSDSSIEWTVPNEPTERLRFRLRQIDAASRSTSLDDGNTTAIGRLAYRSDGKRLIAMHAVNGEVVEWTLNPIAIAWRAMPPDVGRIQPVYVGYVDSMRIVEFYNAGGAGYATLFQRGRSSPLWSGQLTGKTIESVAFDTASNTVALLTTLSSQIEVYSITTDAIIPLRTVSLLLPATALTVGNGVAIVALRTSTLQRYSLPQWTLLDELTVPYLQHVALLHAMPDGRRIAIGCAVAQPSVTQAISAPVYVLDFPSRQIIRSDRRAASTPIAVTASADSRYLVFGFRGQPQSPLWDLAVNQFLGQVTTHQGALGYIQFSPDQRSVTSSSATSPLELTLQTFLFPETVVSSPLTIGTFKLATDTLQFDTVYAYTSADTIFRSRLCNTGTVPIVLRSRWVEGEPTFRLVGGTIPDTLHPGQCADVSLRFSPTRPGQYRGSFVVSWCDRLWRLPVIGTARERHVTFPDTLDVGTTCVGSTTQQQRVVLINHDLAPLPIGGATIYDALRSPFRIVGPPHDTTIEGNSALVMTVEFRPTASGIVTGTLHLYYGWRDYTATIVLRGTGIGGALRPHVSPLPFIPENPVRHLRLHNDQVGALQITEAYIEPTGGFRVLDATPRTVQPGDSTTLAIEWQEPDSTTAVLVLRVEPCGSLVRIPLVRFAGRAELSLPDVQADVRGRANIPILVRFTSNYHYGDPLECTMRIALHARAFMPDSVLTRHGRGLLLSSERISDRRLATIQILRALSTTDTLAILTGWAALGENDTSRIEFSDAPFWGQAVEVNTSTGTL